MTEIVLRAREGAPTPQPTPMPAARALSERLEEATMIAKAGSILPKDYAGNVGACLLAIDFAAKNGLDVLTTVQNVSFIHGKAMISAELWEARANQNGYTIKVDVLTETDCTVSLIDDRFGEVAGSYSSNIDKDRNPKNTIWNSHPRQMLYANAVRNACKFYAKARSIQMFMLHEDDMFEVESADPVEIMAPQPVDTVNLLGEPDPHAGFPPTIDAEGLKIAIGAAGKTQRDVLTKWTGQTLASIAADPKTTADVMAWLEDDGQ